MGMQHYCNGTLKSTALGGDGQGDLPYKHLQRNKNPV